MVKEQLIDRYVTKLLEKDSLTKEEARMVLEYLRPKPKTLLEQLSEIINLINGGNK